MIFAINPFVSSFFSSDFLGKIIFISLFLLSIISWSLLIYKVRTIRNIRKGSQDFKYLFEKNRQQPLHFQHAPQHNPLYTLYHSLRQMCSEILNRKEVPTLSSADVDLINHQLEAKIADQSKSLSSNLFILSTIVSLAPFLGLLGTVWGILLTLGELEIQMGEMSLSGLSMALATTVLGLLVAIPPLIGFNYLRATLSDFITDMHSFRASAVAAVELQYRKEL